MFRTGQIRHESNLLWYLEYKGYHGLKSVSDIPLFTCKQIASQSLTPNQLVNCGRLCELFKPLMMDTVCFQLISMIMMLDTSNLIYEDMSNIYDDTLTNSGRQQPPNSEEWKNESCYSHYDFTLPSKNDPLSTNIISSTSVGASTGGSKTYSSSYLRNDSHVTNSDPCSNKQLNNKSSIEYRFREIKSLQTHYIDLLRNHIRYSNNPSLKYFGETNDGLRNTMTYFKELAYYIELVYKYNCT
jgi:hypothetical protein